MKLRQVRKIVKQIYVSYLKRKRYWLPRWKKYRAIDKYAAQRKRA